MTTLGTDYIPLEGLEDRTRTAWDAFVKEFAPPHFEQTTAWGQARRVTGWEPSLWIIRRDDEIVGGAQILSRRVRNVGRVGYISHGPLFSAQAELPQYVGRELKRLGHRRGFLYLAVNLPYYGHSLVGDLKRIGFRPHLSGLPPSGLAEATLLLNLEPEPETLLSQMRSTTRKEIRRGVRKGVTVRPGDSSDLQLFWDLLVQLCERRKSTPNVAGIGFLRSLWDKLSRNDCIDLLIAEVGGSPICALIVLRFGTWSWLWREGNSFNCFDSEGAQVTYWEAIKLAKARGSKVLDFLGLYPKKDGRIVRDSGVSTSDNPHQGITFFKLGFGGTPIELPGTFGLFPNPLIRSAMRFGGESLIKSRFFKRFIARFNQLG